MKNNKAFIAVSVDADIKKKYLEHCKKYGYSISKRIQLFLEKEINNKVKFDD